MHIFSFFQPHHNPRLLSKPIRQIELCELEQAASELLRAVQRAKERVSRRPTPPLEEGHFNELAAALEFVVGTLQTLSDAHPGDGEAVVRQMIEERREVDGWETWSTLLSEQLAASGGSFSDTHVEPTISEQSTPAVRIKKVA